MIVNETFDIRGRGIIVVGRIEFGEVTVGDEFDLVGVRGRFSLRVLGIDKFREIVTRGVAGDEVGLVVSGIPDKNHITPGDAISRKFESHGDAERKPKLRCNQCRGQMQVDPGGVYSYGTAPSPIVKLRCEHCDITRFENRNEVERELSGARFS
jgi:translation elongation factor EF-1alpha